MRAIEFIRELLDFIEDIESNQKNTVDYETENPNTPVTTKLANSPDERVTSTDTILSIGNDLQKPKHPADIRVSTVALYPNTSYSGDK